MVQYKIWHKFNFKVLGLPQTKYLNNLLYIENIIIEKKIIYHLNLFNEYFFSKDNKILNKRKYAYYY